MSRKLPIFYNALLLTGVNLLLRFVATSFQVFLTGRIGAAGIGLLQLTMSVGAMAMTAGMAGIRTAAMYLTAEELGKKRPQNVTWVLSACFLYSAAVSGSISVALRFLAPFLAQHWIGDPRTADAIRLYACFIPVCCLCGVMTGYFTAANRIGTLAAVEIAEQILYMAVTMAVLMLWAGSDPAKACQSVILGSGIGSCMTLGVLILLRLKERAQGAAPFPIRKRLLETAVPLALADDLRTGISTAENLMVPKRLAMYPREVNPLAAFGTVCGMVFPVLMFPAAILFGLAELLIPELARCAAAGSRHRVRYLTRRSLRLAMLYGCLFCGLEYLLAEPLCTALYSSPDAGEHLRRYALLIPMLYCDAITDAMTKGLGQQKACVRYNILSSSMDVAFLYLLLPHYGMTGYYWSFLITHLLNFLLSLQRLLKTASITLSVKPILLTGIATAGSLVLCKAVSSPIVGAVCFPAVFFSLLVLLQVVGMEDFYWIRGLVSQKR